MSRALRRGQGPSRAALPARAQRLATPPRFSPQPRARLRVCNRRPTSWGLRPAAVQRQQQPRAPLQEPATKVNASRLSSLSSSVHV
eukprot:12878275-Prorocentrum_lima.AAC.1